MQKRLFSQASASQLDPSSRNKLCLLLKNLLLKASPAMGVVPMQ